MKWTPALHLQRESHSSMRVLYEDKIVIERELIAHIRMLRGAKLFITWFVLCNANCKLFLLLYW